MQLGPLEAEVGCLRHFLHHSAGAFSVAEGWITLRGWNAIRDSITHLAGTELTFLLVCAFGIGHLVQELGDVFVHLLKGKRYLRRGRDEFWQTEEARLVKQAIMQESGHDIPSVDGAYDYCLTKLTGHFDKRGIFVATSDLCRSLVALSLIAMIPVGRIALFDVPSIHGSLHCRNSSTNPCGYHTPRLA